MCANPEEAARLLLNADLIIWDADGCIWDRGAPTLGAVELLTALDRRGKILVAATNNSSQTPELFAAKCRDLGFPQLSDPSHVICSGEMTARMICDRHGSSPCVFVLGSDALASTLRNAGCDVTVPTCEHLNEYPETPVKPYDALVVGMDTKVNYTRLAEAIGAGLSNPNPNFSFISTNPDRTFPFGGRPTPGNGVLTAAVAHGIGREPEFVGKPSPCMVVEAQRRFPQARRTVMVGDRLDTDIASGHAAGVSTLLLLTGVTSAEAAAAATGAEKPDAVAGTPKDVWEKIEEIDPK